VLFLLAGLLDNTPKPQGKMDATLSKAKTSYIFEQRDYEKEIL
jgi:hypothetical protein